ncbi:MAG TPA: hybrid sensor histidine kinase/response regulator [Stellaceae bacterium]|jgi:two-component system chemotaxis sensor kinase CheA|nr:hybrid sensor histidine kinase/response regulator [Stellaceae bacterium]
MDDLLKEFITETVESLGILDSELVRLEQNPSDPTLLQNIFRIVHTIKGTCGFLGLPRLQKLAHAAENVLGRFRDGTLLAGPDAVGLVLGAVDGIKHIVNTLAATQAEPAGEDTSLIAALDHLAESEGDAAPTAPEPAVPAAEPAPPAAEARPAEVQSSAEAPPERAKPSEPAHAAPASSAADLGAQAIRVNVDLLEDLMTIASELVLTRNQLMQILRTQKDSVFSAALQRLSQVTTELQEGVMKTRMQPIGNAWAKLPRLVRDLARDLGKKLELRMIGAETELDRQVLEMVRDPLTHMVRNCADHGIEAPAERLAAGKPETGTITLNAHHVGGHIVVEIGDDGRGVSTDRIRKKAIANGLATEAELAAMTEQQIQQFVFRPGFSTAEAVTNISGRGVGLDVVRSNIEKIGGTVELRTGLGKGTKFVIKIPLTLAIVSALIVECMDDRFAIPQINVVELVHTAANSDHRVERLKGVPVLRLRDKILPLVSLRKMLGLAAEDSRAEEGQSGENFVIVTQVGAQSFGIMVDRVFDTEEIVVKPVSPLLRDLSVYSGNTILGDGSVVMILDPNGITALANFTIEEGDDKAAAHAEDKSAHRAENVILFRAGGPEPKALPLELVARLEMLDSSAFEIANGRAVVQYRGALMPILTLDSTAPFAPANRQPILVFSEGEHSIGVAVEEIIDIVETVYSVDLLSERPGILGSAIIAGKATDLIDISHYLTAAGSHWFKKETKIPFGGEGRPRRLLLVDDSPFLRNMLHPLLTTAGYEVVGADSAETALRLCEEGERFDIIISDIEMPRMDGFGFAAKVRESENWRETPLVALTSHVSAKDEERGRRSGFQRHVPKLDHNLLLKAIADTLNSKKDVA